MPGRDLDDSRIQRSVVFIRSRIQERLTLKVLADHVGMSAFHFQRKFKAIVGLTPRQFLEASRLEALRGELRERDSVTDAIYAVGFGSGSRVYERVDTRLGMTPGEYRAGGRGIAISYAVVDSVVGRMMVGATDRGLCFVQFADSDAKLLELLRSEYPSAEIVPMGTEFPDHFRKWMGALGDYLKGDQPHLDLPTDVRATSFQTKVWRYLQSIPYASLRSYSEVAAGVGRPSAVRAVARACASNRLALVIPCHRVIRGTGELGGYKWGIERKRVLIDLERTSAARK